jgi:hypothetical protein
MFKKFTFLLFMCLFTGLSAWGQRTVSGTVMDKAGEPLIAVNVVVQGTTTGTVTDVDGKYSIQVGGADAVLEFTFVGYITIRETVGARNVIDVTLEEDAEVLDEVVVSALGFTQKKDQMGATYSTVNSQDVVRSGETGVINGLGGKAAGVRIARSNGDAVFSSTS